jgi:hypothetical protein
MEPYNLNITITEQQFYECNDFVTLAKTDPDSVNEAPPHPEQRNEHDLGLRFANVKVEH